MSPDDPAAHDLLGLTLAVQDKLKEAAMQFEQALRIDPTYEQAREHLARSRQALVNSAPSILSPGDRTAWP